MPPLRLVLELRLVLRAANEVARACGLRRMILAVMLLDTEIESGPGAGWTGSSVSGLESALLSVSEIESRLDPVEEQRACPRCCFLSSPFPFLSFPFSDNLLSPYCLPPRKSCRTRSLLTSPSLALTSPPSPIPFHPNPRPPTQRRLNASPPSLRRPKLLQPYRCGPGGRQCLQQAAPRSAAKRLC